jgi:hypothetical protein
MPAILAAQQPPFGEKGGVKLWNNNNWLKKA